MRAALGIWRQHKALALGTGVVDAVRAFLSEAEWVGLTTAAALRKELGGGAERAAAAMAAARAAIAAADEAERRAGVPGGWLSCCSPAAWAAKAARAEALKHAAGLVELLSAAEAKPRGVRRLLHTLGVRPAPLASQAHAPRRPRPAHHLSGAPIDAAIPRRRGPGRKL